MKFDMKFDMKYDDFISLFSKASLIFMVVAGLYILVKPNTRNVKNYKLDKDLTYTGRLVNGKFEGEGALNSKDGLYKGDFSKGRFAENGTFIGKDYYYIRENGKVTIKFNDGRVYKKTKDKWEELEKDAN